MIINILLRIIVIVSFSQAIFGDRISSLVIQWITYDFVQLSGYSVVCFCFYSVTSFRKNLERKANLFLLGILCVYTLIDTTILNLMEGSPYLEITRFMTALVQIFVFLPLFLYQYMRQWTDITKKKQLTISKSRQTTYNR